MAWIFLTVDSSSSTPAEAKQ